jgi:hypothetical protein
MKDDVTSAQQQHDASGGSGGGGDQINWMAQPLITFDNGLAHITFFFPSSILFLIFLYIKTIVV